MRGSGSGVDKVTGSLRNGAVRNEKIDGTCILLFSDDVC